MEEKIDEMVKKYDDKIASYKNDLELMGRDNPMSRSFLYSKIADLEKFIEDLKQLKEHGMGSSR